MKHARINLWQEEEYTYPLAFGFMPNIRTYFHEGNKPRPCILIVPGGGYTHCSEAEGEIVAKTFYSFGWNTAVLTYTCNLLYLAPLKDQPLKDLSRAMRILRSNADSYHIDEDDAVTISNFVYDSIKAAQEAGFNEVLFVGHLGKLIKVAGGIKNTHSAYGDHRMEILSDITKALL